MECVSKSLVFRWSGRSFLTEAVAVIDAQASGTAMGIVLLLSCADTMSGDAVRAIASMTAASIRSTMKLAAGSAPLRAADGGRPPSRHRPSRGAIPAGISSLEAHSSNSSRTRQPRAPIDTIATNR